MASNGSTFDIFENVLGGVERVYWVITHIWLRFSMPTLFCFVLVEERKCPPSDPIKGGRRGGINAILHSLTRCQLVNNSLPQCCLGRWCACACVTDERFACPSNREPPTVVHRSHSRCSRRWRTIDADDKSTLGPSHAASPKPLPIPYFISDVVWLSDVKQRPIRERKKKTKEINCLVSVSRIEFKWA